MIAALVALGFALGATGCSLDSLLKSNALPADVSDPAVTQTPAGALAAYYGTLLAFDSAFGGGRSGVDKPKSFIAVAGTLSDELSDSSGLGISIVDQRALPEGSNSEPGEDLYALLQKTRNQARQAIGLLNTYRPADTALGGHLYALQGYTEIFLAELYCSGIPLSTLDYDGDFTYRAGSSTAEVFAHAIALFDTALVLAQDSVQFLDLARVGRARALLALGSDTDYAAAAATVAPVADGYRAGVLAKDFMQRAQLGGEEWYFAVPDREGGNGLDWRSSDDPRTKTTLVRGRYEPDKYAAADSVIVLASGIEARLIEAEAALRSNPADGTWLTKLNALRTDGAYDTTATSPPDTLWHAGIGGVAGLGPLADPGTDPGRVDLLFRERAFWLFLTGHRQGDLRRLIRQYGRRQENIYPVGVFGQSGFTLLLYGADVEIPTPEQNNPLYTGCAARGA